MVYPSKSHLPDPLQRSLEEIGGKVGAGKVEQSDLDNVISRISALPPALIAIADGEIARHARLAHRFMTSLPWDLQRSLGEQADDHYLDAVPRLEYLYIFHRNGYVREAALKRFHGGLTSAFYFTAIAYRLNDWAPQVRKAAADAATIVFPETAPEIVAEAAFFLFARRLLWQRGLQELSVLDRAFSRPDVAQRLATIFETVRTGPAATVLKCILREPGMDTYLSRLAEYAVLPSVRKVALKCLLERRAVWQVGVERQWVDRSLGKYRMAPTLAVRAIDVAQPVIELIRLGAADRSAQVRSAALDALIAHRHSLPIVDEIVGLLRDDKHRSIQERLDFIRRNSASTRNG